MKLKKQRHYLIEYTFDKNHQEWFIWDGKHYASYVQAKDEMNQLAIKEQEYNTNTVEHKPSSHIVFGFRVVEEYTESKATTLTEILF